jgi:protein-disulfide isomerase
MRSIVFAMAGAAALAACGGGISDKQVADARAAVYQGQAPALYAEVVAEIKKEYPNVSGTPEELVVRTAWHPIPLKEHVSTREETPLAATQGGDSQVGEGSGEFLQRRERRQASTDRTKRFFIRFDVQLQPQGVPGAATSWKVAVTGQASEYDGTTSPMLLKGAERPYWLDQRIKKLEVAIHERLESHALAAGGAAAPTDGVPAAAAGSPRPPAERQRGSSGAAAPAAPAVAAPPDRSGELRAGIAALPRNTGRPDPATVYSVPIDGDPVEGNAEAPVTMVIVTQVHPACPYCTRVMPTITQLQGEYGDKLRVAWKQLVVHQHVALPHSLAACGAHRQGQFPAMRERLMAEQGVDWGTYVRLAEGAGLDLERFAADMGSPECVNDVLADMSQAGKLGATGVPAFFINGRSLSGAQPVESFRALIDEELAKAEASPNKGAAYYDSLVKSGKPEAP